MIINELGSRNKPGRKSSRNTCGWDFLHSEAVYGLLLRMWSHGYGVQFDVFYAFSSLDEHDARQVVVQLFAMASNLIVMASTCLHPSDGL